MHPPTRPDDARLAAAPPRPGRPPRADTEARGPWRAAAIQAVALAAAFGLLGVAWLLIRPLALILAAVIVALALAPLVDRLERVLPRVPAVLAVYLALLLVVGGVGWVVVPPMVAQAQALAEQGPDLAERGRAWVERRGWLDEGRIVDAAQSGVRRLGSGLVALPMAVLSAAFELLLVLVISLYWLVAMPDLSRFVLSLVPAERRSRVAGVLGEMGQTMGGYVRGVVLDGLAVGAITYVGLLLIGVDYPLVLALIAAVLELLPVVGPILAAVPALGIALVDSWTQALLVLGLYVAVQQLESYVMLPIIMRSQADIPPLLTLVALLAGAAVGGVVGALLALPLSGALRVFVLRAAAPALRRWTGAEAREAASPAEAKEHRVERAVPPDRAGVTTPARRP